METSRLEQGTEKWKEIKRGKIGGSHISDVLMKSDKAGYRNYMARLVLERVTGTTEETFCSPEMQRGLDLEPLARTCYEFREGVTVDQVAWVDHPYIEWAGVSPDGTIEEDGLIEIKCVNQANHLDLLLDAAKIKGSYVNQMMWQLAVTGRQWCDYVSYNPSFPENLQLKIIRVWRDQAIIDDMEKASLLFNQGVDQQVAELRELIV